MKQIKKLSLSNVIEKLTRNEMRYVLAGTGYDDSPSCYGSETVCHTEGDVNYVCSSGYNADGFIECCCGHDAGESNCAKG